MSLDYHDIQQYAEAFTSPETALLATINQKTHAELPGAQMLSGHLQGQILATFSRMIRPRRILEIGTYTGYATLCLAEGLTVDGFLHTIDSDVRLAARVQEYFALSKLACQIQYHLGKALDIIPQIQDTFDLVFIDADKRNYENYYELALQRLTPHGWLIIDNVLWKGKVLDDESPLIDRQTQTMIDFNHYVRNDTRVVHVLFPVRDGLMVVRKKTIR
jgi:caffeoyl-CoA O-methyltransferase